MGLTSVQIKRLIQPMADFAPAILRCAEIVEAAEQAERTILDSEPVLASLRADIDALQTQQKHEQDALAGLMADVARALEGIAKDKADALAAIQPTLDDLKTAQDALEATQKEHAAVIAAQQQEIAEVDAILAQKRQELSDFKNSVPSL